MANTENGTIKDTMAYIVFRKLNGVVFAPERETAAMDRKTTAREIYEGQFENIVQVLEINPVEGICRDVTEDMLLAAEQYGDQLQIERMRIVSEARAA